MQNLLEKNKNFFFWKKVFFSHKTLIEKLVKALNKDKIVIVSGMRYAGKTKFVLDMVQKTWAKETVFYHNSEVDTLGKILNADDLQTLLDLHKRVFWVPKIIVLQNIHKIEGIKDYIGKVYKEKLYKIIIIGNNIKIGGIQEIQVFPLAIETLWTNKVQSYLKYGGIEEVQLIRDLYFKDFILSSITQNIISQDIVQAYDIKNNTSVYQLLCFLAQNNKNISIRELQRELESEWISIALMTLGDYVEACFKSKLLRKVTKYDIKQDKEIPTKITYYFWDTGIRNSLMWGIESPEIALENSIFTELSKKWYSVYTGVSGRFEMTFRAVQWNTTLSIHIHNSQDKNELRKDARKLTKLADTSKKFLVVQDTEMYNMRKLQFDDVQVVELGELVRFL